jgi:hypothetical protein
MSTVSLKPPKPLLRSHYNRGNCFGKLPREIPWGSSLLQRWLHGNKNILSDNPFKTKKYVFKVLSAQVLWK